MELKLLRLKQYSDRTIGQLYIDDVFFCFTLEDPVRETNEPVEKWKIKGETAIPQGVYRVTFENSPRFGKNTITIHNVPGFTGIRIHAGNTAADTEGCPLVGYDLTWDSKMIKGGTSRPALLDLKGHISRALQEGEEIHITIVNGSGY